MDTGDILLNKLIVYRTWEDVIGAYMKAVPLIDTPEATIKTVNSSPPGQNAGKITDDN